jgi:hypothetical protein
LALIVQQAIRDHRANDSSRCFRTQRERITAWILEREHLFLDDVRELSDGALEQASVFDDRDADLAVRIGSEQLTGDAFESLPSGNLSRQDIVHATRRLDLHWSGRIQLKLFTASVQVGQADCQAASLCQPSSDVAQLGLMIR